MSFNYIVKMLLMLQNFTEDHIFTNVLPCEKTQLDATSSIWDLNVTKLKNWNFASRPATPSLFNDITEVSLGYYWIMERLVHQVYVVDGQSVTKIPRDHKKNRWYCLC